MTKQKKQLKTINLSGKSLTTNKRKFQQDDEDMFQQNDAFEREGIW